MRLVISRDVALELAHDFPDEWGTLPMRAKLGIAVVYDRDAPVDVGVVVD